jgi:hypothetical protein
MPLEDVLKGAQQVPTPELTKSPFSNSPLDAAAITTVVQKLDPKSQLSFSSPAAQIGAFRAYYGFELSTSPPESITVDVLQHISIEQAETAFKARLMAYQGDLDDEALIGKWTDEQQLGQRALQTRKSIYWIHGSTLLAVAIDSQRGKS